MKATQLLHDKGQSLWLDNITLDVLDSGNHTRYNHELPISMRTTARRRKE